MRYGHAAGQSLEIRSLARLTTTVPTSAPYRLVRPPTATHTTISIEGTTPTIAGEISPMCSVWSAPATPANPPAITNTRILYGAGL